MRQKNKTNKNKKSVFSRIIGFFDRHFIVPLSKLAYHISEKFSLKSGTLEKVLNKSNTLLYLSLLIAFCIFIIIDKRVINLVETESLVLEKRPVEIEYNDEAFVVEGLPKTIDIILMGSKSNLYLAKQHGDHKVTLNLSDLGIGTHKVKLKYNHPVRKLDYLLSPAEVNVVIHSKISEVRTLSKDIINTDKLSDTLVVSDVSLDRDEVIIKSYEEKLSKVASVKALIDVNSLNVSTAGTYPMENVKLVAYDEKGTEIDDIEIVPDNITATVTITSPSKVIPIKVVPVGEVAPGNAIASINSSVTQVKVYADESILENLNYLEVKIDVANLKEDKVWQKVLNKPNGARSISESSITIKVTMEKESSKDFNDVPITFENLKEGLKVSAKSENDTKVVISVKGVKSLIDKIDNSDIKAYVDLEGLGKGTHSVPVYVTGNDLKLIYTSKTQTINVIIE